MWNKNDNKRIRFALCVSAFASLLSIVTNVFGSEGLNSPPPPPDYVEFLKEYTMPAETGGVLACSKRLCERLGISISKDKVLQSDDEIGVEFYVEQAPAHYIKERLIPSGFNCRIVIFFPAEWDVYVPNGVDSWNETSPRRYSRVLSGTKDNDWDFLIKKHFNVMFVHTYMEIIKNAYQGKPRSYAESMRAISVVKEVIPGLGMVELKKRCDAISSNDQVAFYLPKQNAYPNGPGTSRAELTDEYFHQVTLPQGFSASLSKLFGSN